MILSKMQEKGAPRKAIRETMQLSTGLRKISAFFEQKVSNDVLSLPEDVEPVSLPTESTEPAVQATILSSDNVQKFIEHLGTDIGTSCHFTPSAIPLVDSSICETSRKSI